MSLGVVPSANAVTHDVASLQRVTDYEFADPDVLVSGQYYYAYTGGSLGMGTEWAASARRSTSPSGPWTPISHEMLTGLPDWVEKTAASSPDQPAMRPFLSIWAPSVQFIGGKWVMYYSAENRHQVSSIPTPANGLRQYNRCIGAAVASGPEGPFVALGGDPLVCNNSESGLIDATGFQDDNGRSWILYKNDGNRVGKPVWIYAQEVSVDGMKTIGSPFKVFSASDFTAPGYGGALVEAPDLVKRPDGTYVLVMSANGTGTNYMTVYAKAASITGPYKFGGVLLTNSMFGGAAVGLGGGDVICRPGSGYQLFVHGRVNQTTLQPPTAGQSSIRAMYTAPLSWSLNNPVLGGTPQSTMCRGQGEFVLQVANSKG